MKGVLVDQDKNLSWSECATPTPGPGEVRIRVRATAINRADLLQRRGFYPPPAGASEIMGLECAGEIDQVGEGVSRWRSGDAVCALLAGGGYAEYAVVHADSVLPVPIGHDFIQAAALPEVFATAWLNLYMEAQLVNGESVLIHAGGSGVGTAAVQLCRSFSNPCFVTAGSEEKLARCIELGAAGGSNRHDADFMKKAREFVGMPGFNVILDPVGAAYLKDNIDLLAMEGQLVLIGLMGGGVTEISLPLLLAKRLRIIGSTLRTRSVEAKGDIMTSLEQNVWPALERGDIAPIIHTVMDIQEVSAAHDLVASDNTIGKVVLRIN